MSATRPQCPSRLPSHAMVDVASQALLLQPPPLLRRQVAAMLARFPMARCKLLARQVALEETTPLLLLEAPEEATRLRLLEAPAAPRLHRRAEPRTLVAALTTVLSAHQLLAVTPSAPARNAPRADQRHLATLQRHQEDLVLTPEMHPTPTATAQAVHAPVLSAQNQAAVPAAAPILLKRPLVEQACSQSALSHHCAWPQSLLLLHSHSDRTPINIFGHSAKVRDI